MNFIGNLPFSYLERVFPIKTLSYLFFPAEIRTVTNSRHLNLKKSTKKLFFNWLSQTDENLK